MAHEDLKQLARGVVLAQGNVYIKELLRQSGLQISGSKQDFVERLEGAIDDGTLTAQDFEVWLREVEGWGSFHIYPFRVPRPLTQDVRWTRPRKRIRDSALESVWDAETSMVFPDELTLTHASLGDGALRLTWHQGIEGRVRVPSMDRREVIDDDVYEFDAYRVRRERTVVRFALRLEDGIAAALVPYGLRDERHSAALTQIWDSLEPLLTQDDLVALRFERIIHAADRQQLDGGGQLTTKYARLVFQDAWVDFGTSSPDVGYADVEAAREWRRAAPDDFVPNRASFLYPITSGARDRDVTVVVSGPDRRVWIQAQAHESDVWELLNLFVSLQ